MSTDKKEFNRRALNSDKTALGFAINSLLSLENRWEDKKEKIVETVEFLNEIRDKLSQEGHKAYRPKIIEEDIVEEVLEVKPTAAELAAELEEKRLVKEAEEKLAKINKLKADLEELEIKEE
jgi:hypothetical protein